MGQALTCSCAKSTWSSVVSPMVLPSPPVYTGTDFDMKKTLLAAFFSLLGSSALFAQAPGTCAGMTPGQLTSLNGFVPFQGTPSLWNTNISAAPVDPNSFNILNFIGLATTLHPDFGQGNYDGQSIGIPYQIVPGTQPKVTVSLGAYASESDPGPMPIPTNALIEGYPK